MKIENIRNFCIIAHIDHGKSTVSDRLIEKCVESRHSVDRMLDSMELEKERGITIKSQTARLTYTHTDGQEYTLNLMDTPGHVDFGYEVSRCLAACEAAILLIDATQGIEAQTMANAYKALEADIEIIPVLNKIDLPSANVEGVKSQIEESLGIDTEGITCVSGKTGAGIDDLLRTIVEKINPPKDLSKERPKALLIDAWYDIYLGVLCLIRVVSGEFNNNSKIKMLANNSIFSLEHLGVFNPKKCKVDKLISGEVGYFCANIKNVKDCNIGDTVVLSDDEESVKLPGFKKNIPAVFASLYPVDSDDYILLKEAVEKLSLNDSSVAFEPESSDALGFGMRCSFLGLLHMEIFTERVKREFNLDIIITTPNVSYEVFNRKGEKMQISSPSKMPDPSVIDKIFEPYVKMTIITPDQYTGDIMTLCNSKRGIQNGMKYSIDNVVFEYFIPLAEIIYNFHDKMKSVTKGYASFEWELFDYRQAEIVKIDILLNHEPVDAMSFMCHKSLAVSKGKVFCERLKELLPRQMFSIPIQAAIGGTIIARETISALRKDVTAKCYGGDISRKRKLLEKQKAGKKRMKSIGSVEIPNNTFIEVLKNE